ncbi:DNA replication factor Cdt1 [Armadillidium nasatum]|uniref:DNA replication factor Cdt1 n=1 Tax=Armadillidium nasatum TaxID=96803 RepID=A0A5N5T937_9CRUS|nr:DNA replication factor Cdt1 [Armadillidium nasatum]
MNLKGIHVINRISTFRRSSWSVWEALPFVVIMSVTQPNLHKYFKVKKQIPNSFCKDGKIKEGGKISTCDTFEKKNSEEKIDDSLERKTENVAYDSLVTNIPIAPSNESSETKTEVIPCNDSLEVQSQQTITCELEEKSFETIGECTNSLSTEKETEIQTLKEDICSKITKNELPQLLTPPLKKERSDVPSRKRKRDQERDVDFEASPTKTPKKNEDVSSSEEDAIARSQTSTPTAKKRLILNKDDERGRNKPLDPVTMKEKLGKCGRLDELRAKLLKLSQCEKKLQAFRSQSFVTVSPKKQNLKSSSPVSYKTCKVSPYNSPLKDKKTNSPHSYKNFSSLDIEVPLSPSKSPAKVGTPKKYCYERFRHLSDPSADQLHLPYRYQMIKEVFRAVDTVVSILHNRQEIITYSKLKPAVQEMLRKTFSETHLGQLKTVFPLAYFFTHEKFRDPSRNTKLYQLTMKPNLDYKPEKKTCSRNLMSELNHSANVPTLKFRKMDSVVLVERREIFHMSLLDISLNPPIVIDGTIRRWHPDFPIDDISPPPPAELPQPPKSDVPESAKDVLDKAREIFSVNNRMKEAVETLFKENKEISACLKGISSSLLEKIRAREAAKAARDMTRSSSSSQELEYLSRLPELVRILRSLFVMEKKAALPWEIVVVKSCILVTPGHCLWVKLRSILTY